MDNTPAGCCILRYELVLICVLYNSTPFVFRVCSPVARRKVVQWVLSAMVAANVVGNCWVSAPFADLCHVTRSFMVVSAFPTGLSYKLGGVAASNRILLHSSCSTLAILVPMHNIYCCIITLNTNTCLILDGVLALPTTMQDSCSASKLPYEVCSSLF